MKKQRSTGTIDPDNFNPSDREFYAMMIGTPHLKALEATDPATVASALRDAFDAGQQFGATTNLLPAYEPPYLRAARLKSGGKSGD